MGQLFDRNSPKYMTSEIEEKLPQEIIQFLWECIEDAKNEVILDYLQVFKLDVEVDDVTGAKVQRIVHTQEEPMYSKEYNLKLMDAGIIDTIFVIDDITHQTILFARNY